MGCLPAGAAIDHAPRRAAARDAVSAPDCSPACLHRLTSTGACAASLPRPANHSADALHCPFAEAFACLPTHPTFCAGRPGSSRWRPPCPSSCSPSQSCVGQMEWAPAQASDVECCAAMPSASSFLLDKRSGRQHRRAEQFRPQRQPLCILVLLLPRAAGNQQQSSKAEQFFPGLASLATRRHVCSLAGCGRCRGPAGGAARGGSSALGGQQAACVPHGLLCHW